MAFPYFRNSYSPSRQPNKLSRKRAYIVEASSFDAHCARGTIAAAASTTSGFVDVSNIQRITDDLLDMLGVEVDLIGGNVSNMAPTSSDPGVWKGLSGRHTDAWIVPA